jgi:predicted nucleic-acid-binding Zn-ribbon protein
MKKSLMCPKCEGRQIWRIDTVKVRTAPSPTNLPLVVRSTWRGLESSGGFEAFICNGCGYTEWYAHGLDELKHDPQEGVQLIDNRPTPGLR